MCNPSHGITMPSKRHITNHDTTSDYYAPNDYLTRADAAIIASRLYGLHNTSVSLRQFNDSNEIPYGSEIHFKNLINAGIMSGYPDRTLRPNQDNRT